MDRKPKFDLITGDIPVVNWMLTTGMALGHARMFSGHPKFLQDCFATMSLARREFYAALAERGERIH